MAGSHFTGPLYIRKSDGTYVEFVDEEGNIQASVDLGQIEDANGNEMLEFDTVASAITYVRLANAATGDNPVISAQGEVDTGLEFHTADNEEMLILEAVASGVNEITITNAATGNNPTIACTGEVNTGITFQNSEGEEILILDSIATSVNELTIRSAATGNKPIIAATGEADNGIEFHNDQGEEILILQSAATSVNEVTITSSATGADVSIAATGDDANISIALTPKGTGTVDASSGGINTKQSVANVTEAAPTDAELDSAFGTPATLGRGFIGTIDDNDADAASILCWTSDASWYHVVGVKST